MRSAAKYTPTVQPAEIKPPTIIRAWDEAPKGPRRLIGGRKKLLRGRNVFEDIDSRRELFLRHSHVTTASTFRYVDNFRGGLFSP